MSTAGNGSQWPKMGVDLLSESAAFRRGVTACATALKPYGLDLMAAFSQEDGFSDPIMAAVSLIAVQVSRSRAKLSCFVSSRDLPFTVNTTKSHTVVLC